MALSIVDFYEWCVRCEGTGVFVELPRNDVRQVETFAGCPQIEINEGVGDFVGEVLTILGEGLLLRGMGEGKIVTKAKHLLGDVLGFAAFAAGGAAPLGDGPLVEFVLEEVNAAIDVLFTELS